MDLGLRWWVWEFGMPHLLVPVHRISLFYLRVSESNLTDTNSCMILEGMCDCKNDDAQTSEQDIIYIHTLHLSLILWNRKFQFSSCRYQPALRSPRRWSWSHVPVSVWFIYDIMISYISTHISIFSRSLPVASCGRELSYPSVSLPVFYTILVLCQLRRHCSSWGPDGKLPLGWSLEALVFMSFYVFTTQLFAHFRMCQAARRECGDGKWGPDDGATATAWVAYQNLAVNSIVRIRQ